MSDIKIDKDLYYQLAKYMLEQPYPTWDDIREFENIFNEMDGYAGCEYFKMVIDLKERGFDEDKITEFAVFFICKGIQEDWLIEDIGIY